MCMYVYIYKYVYADICIFLALAHSCVCSGQAVKFEEKPAALTLCIVRANESEVNRLLHCNTALKDQSKSVRALFLCLKSCLGKSPTKCRRVFFQMGGSEMAMASRPMLTLRGTSGVSRHLTMAAGKVGRLRAITSVGFRLSAPRRPCDRLSRVIPGDLAITARLAVSKWKVLSAGQVQRDAPKCLPDAVVQVHQALAS